LERRSHRLVLSILVQARHDAENGISPLAKRYKIVEAFKDNVFLSKMLSVARIPESIIGDGLVGIGNPLVRDVVEPRIDPFCKERPKRPHGHIVFVYDLLQWIAKGERVLKDSPIART
jgi:hypothetical protein